MMTEGFPIDLEMPQSKKLRGIFYGKEDRILHFIRTVIKAEEIAFPT